MSFVRFRGWVVPVMLGSALAVGCSGAASVSPDPGGAASAQEHAADDPDQRAEQLHKRFRDALMRVDLRPDQKAQIEKIEAGLEPSRAAAKTARDALRAAVADQVQRGAIDKAALKPQIDAVANAADQSAAAHRAAFVQLHDLLDSNQRNQFVDNVESDFRDDAAKYGWRCGHHGKKGGLHAFAEELGLSDQQRQQIRSAIQAQLGSDGGPHHDFREDLQRAHQALESFRQDQFTPDPAASPFSKDKVLARIDRMLTIAQIATPILTPDQRTTAAAKIRDGKWQH